MQRLTRWTGALLLTAVLAGCGGCSSLTGSSPAVDVTMATDAALVQKTAVEGLRTQLEVLHIQGHLSDANFQQAVDKYHQWQAAETALADTIAAAQQGTQSGDVMATVVANATRVSADFVNLAKAMMGGK